jgi:hypothetical protein
MYTRCQPQTSYGHGGSCICKRTSNYIFYQVEELIQGDLGYLVQVFGRFPTQISKFFGLGELYAPTEPDTGQLWTWGSVHIKGHVQLHILSGGRRFLRGSWLLGAGVWWFPHTNFEIFGFLGTLVRHRSSYRPAMATGVGTY